MAGAQKITFRVHVKWVMTSFKAKSISLLLPFPMDCLVSLLEHLHVEQGKILTSSKYLGSLEKEGWDSSEGITRKEWHKFLANERE